VLIAQGNIYPHRYLVASEKVIEGKEGIQQLAQLNWR